MGQSTCPLYVGKWIVTEHRANHLGGLAYPITRTDFARVQSFRYTARAGTFYSFDITASSQRITLHYWLGCGTLLLSLGYATHARNCYLDIERAKCPVILGRCIIHRYHTGLNATYL